MGSAHDLQTAITCGRLRGRLCQHLHALVVQHLVQALQQLLLLGPELQGLAQLARRLLAELGVNVRGL